MTSTCPAGHTSTSDDYCDVCGMPIVAAGAGQGMSGPGTAPPPTDVPTQAPAVQVCPHCETPNVADALFCEACGYDFTTGTMPRSAPLAPPEGLTPSQAATPPDASSPPEPAAQHSPPDAASPHAPAGSSALDLAGAHAAADGAANVSADLDFRWVAEVWIDPAWYEVQESPEALPSAGLPAIVPLRNRSVLIGRKSRSRNISPDIDCEPDTGTSRRQAQLTTDGTRWWVEDLESSNGTFVAAASEPLPEVPIAVGVKRELNPDDRIYLGAWTRIVIREATEDELSTLG
jgi:hypothetical protein